MAIEKETTPSTSRFAKSKTEWAKAIVWCLLYILFIIWVGSYGWLILLPLIFDAFITEYVPWTWWKKSKNKTVLAVMGWVDAIVFALVAVYFINTYLFQNYQIPTSSLEKTLLVGDFLFVSKASYGPRVPNTPLSFPLVQHTFPLLNCKSFIENPQWEYKRLQGIDEIERNDIVVFNFPCGDTVPTKAENPGYYQLCYEAGRQHIAAQDSTIARNTANYYSYGRKIVRSTPETYGEIVYRPVDRRENYVKRCVAIAGDWIKIVDNQLYVNDKPQEKIPGIQLNYFVQTDGTQLSSELLDKLHISVEDRLQYDPSQAVELAKHLGFDPSLPIYHFPMNEDTHAKMQQLTGVVKIKVEPTEIYGGEVFPLGGGKPWTRDNFGPLYIPKRGDILKLNKYNLPLYERAISVYEHNKLEVKGEQIFINDKLTSTYQFKMNYYWMMGDNRHNSADSRYWGFVPEDHVVGRPVAVWLSLDKDKGWFEGKIRWNRFFKNAEQ